jgi:hypothetical protein
MRSISIKGQLIAFAVTLALDLVSGIGLMVALGGPVLSDAMTPDETSETIIAFTLSMPYLLGSLVLGTLTTVLGGYIAARFGKTAPFLNSGIFGVLGALLGLALSAGTPLWFTVAGVALIIPAALLGGSFVKRSAAG